MIYKGINNLLSAHLSNIFTNYFQRSNEMNLRNEATDLCICRKNMCRREISTLFRDTNTWNRIQLDLKNASSVRLYIIYTIYTTL